jgi:phosphoribosylamine--glycine ligase
LFPKKKDENIVVGFRGREHALAWKIAQSPKTERLFIAPGNAGTSGVGINVPLALDDFAAVRDFALKEQIDMLVVGPEDPLVKGISDYFASDPLTAGIPVIGPSKSGARLEGSKDFSKAFYAEA